MNGDVLSNIGDLISPESAILVPVLLLAGMGIKRSGLVKPKFIPLILGALGVILSIAASFAMPDAPQNLAGRVFFCLTQGILAAGESVYIHQIVKQAKKEE